MTFRKLGIWKTCNKSFTHWFALSTYMPWRLSKKLLCFRAKESRLNRHSHWVRHDMMKTTKHLYTV